MQNTAPGPTSSYELSLELLRKDLPGEYRHWVATGIVASLIGYLFACLTYLYDGYGWSLFHLNAPYVVLADLFAASLWRFKFSRSAAALALTAPWIDLHVSILTTPNPIDVPALVVVPVFVLASGLLFGGKASFVSALVNAVTIPSAIYLSGQLGWGLGFAAKGSLLQTVVLEAVLGTTTVLVAMFLRTLSRVLQQSQTNEKRARELIENSPDAIIAFSPKGRVEAFNRSAEKLLGVPRSAAMGLAHNELPLGDSDGIWGKGLAELVSRRDPVLLRTAHAATQLEALIRPTTRPDNTQGLLVVLRDVTKRLEAESRAGELQGQLLHAQKLEAMGRLAGGIAHDFNNLLTGVAGYGTLLSDASDSDSREIGSELLAMQERGATLVRQLLAFARKDVSKPRAMDVTRILIEMVTLLERLLGEQVTLDLHVRAACPIMADPGKIEQVILNLAVNAKDAMPKGGDLHILCDADDEVVTLTVADTGMGMSQETLSQIFEPFFTTKTRGKGTGLGLSMVHGIVVDSGGTIEVISEEGEGTRFIIRWPKCDTDIEFVTPEARKKIIRGNGQRVFVLEDNDTMRTFLKRLLDRRGFEVTSARNAEVAKSLFDELDAPPDLILSDVVMPGMSGPQFVKQVLERWPDIAVLFMSGYLGDDASDFEFDLTTDLIAKPFKAEDLMERLAEKLNLKTD